MSADLQRHHASCRRVTEIGAEKRCCDCGNFWPADGEFFYTNTTRRDGLCATCRACQSEKQRERRGRTPQAVIVPEVFSAVQWGGQ